MFDPITLVVGGALSFAGWVVGRNSRRRQVPEATKSALCSCTHGFGTHQKKEDGQPGPCNGQIKRAHYWTNGYPNGFEYVPCPCVTYDGPVPLSEIWTP